MRTFVLAACAAVVLAAPASAGWRDANRATPSPVPVKPLRHTAADSLGLADSSRVGTAPAFARDYPIPPPSETQFRVARPATHGSPALAIAGCALLVNAVLTAIDAGDIDAANAHLPQKDRVSSGRVWLKALGYGTAGVSLLLVEF